MLKLSCKRNCLCSFPFTTAVYTCVHVYIKYVTCKFLSLMFLSLVSFADFTQMLLIFVDFLLYVSYLESSWVSFEIGTCRYMQQCVNVQHSVSHYGSWPLICNVYKSILKIGGGLLHFQVKNRFPMELQNFNMTGTCISIPMQLYSGL